MIQNKFYTNGQSKSEGNYIEIVDCTSRSSGNIIAIDNHKGCVECLIGATLRKTGLWKYFSKSGRINIEGRNVMLDYVGVPSERDGLWIIYTDNGNIQQQIIYDCGNIKEIRLFDEDGNIIE